MIGWLPLTSAAFVVALIVVVMAVFARSATRGGRPDDPSTAVGVTLWVAAAWTVFSVIGAAVVVLSTLLQPDVTITVPVQEFWPGLPPGTVLEGASAVRASGGFTSAELVVTDLSTGARVLWAISQGVAWLLPGAVAALIALACFQLRAGRPFAPVLARMAMVTAVVVALGGLVMQVLGDIAGTMAAGEVLRWTSAEYPAIEGVEDALDLWWPQPGFSVSFPFWPIAAGLAFAALAAIFRYGSRLQRDTEGLV